MMRRSLSPIGLDIGAASVRAAQLSLPSRGAEHGGELPHLVAATIVPRLEPGSPISEREVDRLTGILDRQGFVGRQVVAAIPDDLLLSTSFELPAPAGSTSAAPPLAAISRVELARAAGCGPQLIESAAWPMPRTPRSRATSVMAVGCLNAHADAILSALETSGLDCIALDCRPTALVRAVYPETCTKSGICAVVDLDWNTATAAVLLGGTIIYQRTGPIGDTGGGSLPELVRDNLGVSDELAQRLLIQPSPDADPEEPSLLQSHVQSLIDEHLVALAEELSMAIAYASHRYPEPAVELLLLTGHAARLSGAATALAARLETQVRIFDPAQSTICDAGLERAARHPALAAALGLALWNAAAPDAGAAA